MTKSNGSPRPRLRSQLWFDNRHMTALHLERYPNYGLAHAELTLRKVNRKKPS